MPFEYFSQLPIIEYPLNKDTNKKARDILHRLFVDQKFIDKSDYIRQYRVDDGDRPETISDKLYRRSDVHSIIMLLNEFDSSALSGLPPQSLVYEEYLQDKYSDNVYYLRPAYDSANEVSSGAAGLSGGYIHPIFGFGFEVGEKIFGTDAASFQVYGTRAYVKEWDPVMCSLKLDVLSGSFYPGLTISGSDSSARFVVSKVSSGLDAVHHFEMIETKSSNYQPIVKGSIVDPLSAFSFIGVSGTDVIISPIGINKNGFTGDYFRSIIYRHNTNLLQSTNYYKYVRVVTNREYEEKLQERKRIINVPMEETEKLGEVLNTVTELLETTTG